MRVAGRTLGSLLLGGAAVLGSVLVFRQGLLPLIDAVFQPGPELLSAFRRAGILLSAMAGYWAYVHWHERREATELRLRPVHLMLGGASGTVLVALPIAVLFALGAYEKVLFRGVSPALWSVAVLIGIAAVLEELVENVGMGRIGDVVAVLVSVTLLGLLWGGLFVLARNLWVVAANHAAWNFTILLSGVPLSGIEDWRDLAPFKSIYAGPDWLTGGVFGPEGSLLVIVSTMVAVALLLRAAWRRGDFLEPGLLRGSS
jgi:hypothetical protein